MTEKRKMFWGWVLTVVGTLLLTYGIVGLVIHFI